IICGTSTSFITIGRAMEASPYQPSSRTTLLQLINLRTDVTTSLWKPAILQTRIYLTDTACQNPRGAYPRNYDTASTNNHQSPKNTITIMKSLKLLTYLIVSGSLLFTLSSCDEASTSPGGGEDNGEVSETQYTIAASSGENSYLLQTDNVASGSVSAQSEEAIQVLGNRSWFFFEDIAAYSFLYAKGEPGTVSS